MNKLILSLFAVLSIAALSSAQVEMYVDGGTTNYAGGGVLTVNAVDGNELIHEIHVENHSGMEKDWFVSRTRINRPVTWTDFLCWGHQSDQFGGICIDGQTMDMDPWSMLPSQAVTVSDGEYGFISSHIFPSMSSPAVVTYRYYIGTVANPYEDSMDIEVSLVLSVPEIAPLSVSLMPNPASEQLTINTSGVHNASAKMIDVLGNVVMQETITGNSKTINVKKFKNGIYFLTISAEGVKPVTRRVLIRH
jgi:hypothetical protein